MAKAYKWSDVRDTHPVDPRRVRNAEKELRETVRAHRLAEVRKAQGVTQTDLADMLHVSQARVSKLERGEIASTQVGTLQGYVEALGGSLRVVADFGDTSLTIASTPDRGHR